MHDQMAWIAERLICYFQLKQWGLIMRMWEAAALQERPTRNRQFVSRQSQHQRLEPRVGVRPGDDGCLVLDQAHPHPPFRIAVEPIGQFRQVFPQNFVPEQDR